MQRSVNKSDFKEITGKPVKETAWISHSFASFSRHCWYIYNFDVTDLDWKLCGREIYLSSLGIPVSVKTAILIPVWDRQVDSLGLATFFTPKYVNSVSVALRFAITESYECTFSWDSLRGVTRHVMSVFRSGSLKFCGVCISLVYLIASRSQLAWCLRIKSCWLANCTQWRLSTIKQNWSMTHDKYL